MNKIKLSYFFLGVFMSIVEAKALPDFDILWNFNNPAETEAKFKALIPDARKSIDKDYHLQLLTQIARTQGLQRKFEDAHKTLDEIQEALSPQTLKAEVRYLLERGRVFNSSKKSEQAHPLFIKAFDLALARGMDNLAVDSAHMVAITEPNPEKQLEWNLKAMSIAEKSKDQKARAWLGSLYNNMGWTYHDSGRFDEALDMFQKALVFRESKGEVSSIRVAKWSVARTYRSMKRYEEALKIQTVLENDIEKSESQDGYVFEELGELYLLISSRNCLKNIFLRLTKNYQKMSGLKQTKPNDLNVLKS